MSRPSFLLASLLSLLLPLCLWAGTPLSQGKGQKKGLLKQQEPSLESTVTLKTLTVAGEDEPATLSTSDLSLRSLSESGEESYPHRVLLLDNYGAYATEAARIRTALEGLGATVTYLVSDSRNLGNEEVRTNPFDQIWYLDLATGTSYSSLDCSRTASWYQGRLTGIWAEQGYLLSPSRQSHGAAVVDGLIHLLGGRYQNGTFVLQHHVYDPKTETWSSKADLPTGRDYLAVAAVGRKIFVVGGSSAAHILPIPATDPDPSLAVTEIYDVDSDTWVTGAPMPTPRYGLVAAQVGGKVYAIGGRSGTTNLSVVEEYDPATDRWSTKASMPTPRHAGACAVIDGKIHVLGGSGDSSYTNAHEVYDPVTDTWSSSTPMLTKRAGLAAASVDGKLYAMDGYNATDGGGLRISRCFDPVTAEWTTGPSFHYACLRSASVVDGVIHFFGGIWSYSDTHAHPFHDVFDPPKPDRGLICDGRLHFSLTEARAAHGAAIVQNYYEALRNKGGGLVVATYGNAQSDYGADNVLTVMQAARFDQFSFGGSIPSDSANPLMSVPNSLGTSLPHDGTTPGRAPRGLQSSGLIVYPVAWTANYTLPVVSSTIKGLAGMQVQIAQPADGGSALIHRPVTFEASCTDALAPISYAWTSDRDGPLGTGATLITSALSLGMHEITVRAIDARSFGAEERISFAVNPDNLPDLVASSLRSNPDSALSERDPVSLTVRVSNEGNSACTEAVDVDFRIDGVSIGRVVLSASLASGAATELTTSWTAVKGDHQLSVMIDPDDQLLELQKENNQAWLDLPRVADVFPPEPPTNLRIANTYYDRLGFSWDASANSAGDLAGYRVYVDGSSTPEILPASHRSFYLYLLTPGSKHGVAVTAIDGAGNESEPLAGTDYTLFRNPSNLVATPYSGYMAASWSGVSPVENLKHYAVYVEEASFTSVSGLTPKVCTLNTSASVAQLVDGVTYYVAVTAVNAGDGEAPGVTPVSINAIPDEFGPEISNIRFDGVVIEDGATLTRSGTLAVQAQDPAGVSRVEFYVDGSLVHSVVDTGPDYTMPWDLLAWEDGTYALEVKAFDSFANGSTTTQSLVVALAPPSAATILSPADGLVTDQDIVLVSGSGAPNTTAVLYMDGQLIAGCEARIDGTGAFSMFVRLVEGNHVYTAASRNRAGTGAPGLGVSLTFDTSGPDRPTHLAAEGQAGGIVQLGWSTSGDASVVGYHLYRSTTDFTSKDGVQRITVSPVVRERYDDHPGSDGVFYYRVASVDELGRESSLSEVAWATADEEAPRVLSMSFSPEGLIDPVTEAIAPGRVGVELTVSEPLGELPFLSMNPEGGSPWVVSLSAPSFDSTHFSGTFEVPADGPSGIAHAVFSAIDTVGNRGSDIDGQSQVLIDARAPAIRRIEIAPAEPVKNEADDPVTVVVTFGLDEAQAEATTPVVMAQLSNVGRTPILVSNLALAPTTAGDAQTWQGRFDLPADAGADGGECFVFVAQLRDALGNEGNAVLCPNSFQVFEGDLPPLAVPIGLVAQSYPGGEVRLSWRSVNGAAGYHLLRQAPGESELSHHAELSTTTSFIETPLEEGSYRYAVASVRRVFDMMSVSAPSPAVSVSSDATAPGVPSALQLSLGSRGVECRWTAPPFTEDTTYTVYRTSGESLTTLEGVRFVGVGIRSTSFVDATPTPFERCYAVTALDEAGNESAPSPSKVIDYSILPVDQLILRQVDGASPTLTWHHEGTGLSGFTIQVDGLDVASLGNEATCYVDTGYAAGGRSYVVIAESDAADASPPRSVFLPDLVLTREDTASLKRGLVNCLSYRVLLRGEEGVDACFLHLDLLGRRYSSEAFDLLPGQAKVVSILVPGTSELPDSATAQLVFEQRPGEGEVVEISRSEALEVREGTLIATLETENFVSGGTGILRFLLENPGDGAVDVVMANPGQNPSDDVTILLKTPKGSVLAAVPMRLLGGAGLYLTGDGTTIARILPDGAFRSADVEIPIPSTASEEVELQLVIGRSHWRIDEADHTVLPGLNSSKSIPLISTSYRAEVTEITPERSTGHEEILITGHALDRSTGDASPDVPVTLVIAHDGFERSVALSTDTSGTFGYAFTPLPGEGGSYEAFATHPEVSDTLHQAEFWIDRVVTTPSAVNLHMPRNYRKALEFDAENRGSELENLRLVYDRLDQTEGVLPEGVHVELPSAISLSGGSSHSMVVTIWADNASSDTPTIVLRLVSGSEARSHGRVVVNMTLSEALPAIACTPGFLETGMGLDEQVTETVEFRNDGLAPAESLSFRLLDESKNSAPSWVALASSSTVSSLPEGEKLAVSLIFRPVAGEVQEGIHVFYLRASASNHSDFDVPIHAVVTASGKGNAQFHLADIYTDTMHPDTQELIPGLQGATVKVQNELVASVVATGTTTSSGLVGFSDLPAGRYLYRVSASGHSDSMGFFWVKPGVTTSVEAFLKSNLVTVEWSVKETTIRDTYTIVLSATYETDVPAAVVVAEPSSTNLPPMRAGDVYQGAYRLTNYGLIRATDMHFTLPVSDEQYRFELLQGLPETLGAKESVVIPFRVICLQSEDRDGDASGGGDCKPVLRQMQTLFTVVCAGGRTYKDQVTHSVVVEDPDCVDGSSSDGRDVREPPKGPQGTVEKAGDTPVKDFPDRNADIVESKPEDVTVDSTGGGGSGSYTGDTVESIGQGLSGNQCIQIVPGDYTVLGRDLDVLGQEILETGMRVVGCAVNELSQGLHDQETDLVVKVPGGVVPVVRRYSFVQLDTPSGRELEYRWSFDLWDHDALTFVPHPISYTSGSDAPESDSTYPKQLPAGVCRPCVMQAPTPGVDIRMNGMIFSARSGGWGNGRIGFIAKEGDYFFWRGKVGHWKQFNVKGQLVALGDGCGTLATIDLDEQGKPLQVKDRNGRAVLFFEYSGALLSSIRTHMGRRVDYQCELAGRNSDRLLIKKVVTHPEPSKTYEATYQYWGTKMTSKIDAAGRLTEIKWNGQAGVASRPGNVGVRSVVDSRGMGKSFWYGHNELTDQYTCRTQYSSGLVRESWYDSSGNVLRVDVNGRTISLNSRVDGGRKVLSTDEKGRKTTRYYDAFGDLTKAEFETAVFPLEAQYFYRTDRHLISRLKDLRGSVTEMAYDARGLLLRRVEALGTPSERAYRYEYDPASARLLTASIEGDENTAEATTRFEYDADDNLVKITDPEGNVTQLADFDDAGNAWTIIDPRGNTWKRTYDALGRQTSLTNPLGNSTAFEWGGANNRIGVINAALKRYGMEYDDHNNLVRVVDPLGNAETTTYNSLDLPTESVNPVGGVTKRFYDSEGRLKRIVDPDGNGSLFEYELSNLSKSSSYLPSRIIRCSGADQHICRVYEIKHLYYDRFGRVVRVIEEPVGGDLRETVNSYDARGDLCSVTRADGEVTRFTYDDRGRRTRIISPVGGVTQYEYDDRDNLIREINPKGQVTRYVWDRNGNLVSKTLPLGQVTSFEYDPTGNLVKTIKANGATIERTYDSANRVTQVDYYTAVGSTTPVSSVRYGYDVLDQVISWSDGVASGTFTYDDCGRKISETVDYGPFALTYSYEFDAAGQKSSMTYADGTKLSFQYRKDGRLLSVGVPNEGDLSYCSYDLAGPSQIMLPGGAKVIGQYDTLMRLKAWSAVDPAGQTRFTRSYGYNRANLVTSVESEHGSYSFAYDKYRLVSASGPLLSQESYVYDDVNNRYPASNPDLWVFDENDRLMASEGFTFEYDANGNRTRRFGNGSNVEYSWSADDRLISVSNPALGSQAGYHFDPFGRRLWKEVNGQRTYYQYSDEGLIGEYDQGGGQTVAYGWVPDSPWSSGPLFQKREDKVYWYINDHRGAPCLLVESSGRAVWEGRYESFGRCQVVLDTVESNLRLPGQYFDAETGLHWNLNRFYDPATGRYLSVDPLEDGQNLYAYLGGDPLNAMDPEGACAAKIVRAANGVVKVAVGIGTTIGTCGIGAAVGIPVALYGVHEVMAALSGPVTGYELDVIAHYADKLFPENKEAALVLELAVHTFMEFLSATPVCFAKGTKVLTQDGLRNIETLRRGEIVASKDPQTGKLVWIPISAVTCHRKEQVLALDLEMTEGKTDRIVCTREHPFYLECDARWIAAREIIPGMLLSTANGRSAKVVCVEPQGEPVDVYNLELSAPHTYFVGAIEVLVHNSCRVSTGPRDALGRKGVHIHHGQHEIRVRSGGPKKLLLDSAIPTKLVPQKVLGQALKELKRNRELRSRVHNFAKRALGLLETMEGHPGLRAEFISLINTLERIGIR